MNADATVSLSISQHDTKHEFDDLAHVLTSALACHREAGSLRVGAQGLFVKPARAPNPPPSPIDMDGWDSE